MKKIKLISKYYSFMSVVSIMLLLSACGGGGGNSGSSSSGGGSTDTNKPKITLIGEKTVLLNVGQTYNDPGATAYDQEDGDLTASITKTSNIDFNKIGNYEIIYSVTDSAGNTDTAKRKIAIQNIINNPSPRPGLTINEFSAANTNTIFDPEFKELSDWIELYNNTNNNISLGGYYLSDDPALPNKWRIPNGTVIPAKQYLLIWADKKDTGLHTNFSLNADGEVIILSNPAQAVVDKIEFPKQKSDISCMKNSDGVLYYMYPSPGRANTQANSALFRSREPVFTLESGFYNGAQKLTISQEYGAKIYYTTDGSIPTRSSRVYTQPITINKTTVIRAKALEKGRFLSSTENGTYFIGENISLPVISVAINPDYLYNNDYGIYTDGGHGLNSLAANFRQDWERSASVEYFDKNKVSQFSQNIGLSIFGNYTRIYAKKSFAVKTKDKYGKKSIKYKLFPQKELDKFTSFGIRSGGNGWHFSVFKDAMLQDLVHENMDVDYQANQPVVLFVNGEYWGVSYLRERFNKDYFKYNNGVKEKIDLLELNALVKKGDATDYNNLITYISTHNLADNSAYNEVLKQIDLNNYLNYMVTEIYTGNLDWPNNNVRYWKEKTEDGKWRWLVYDLDNTFGLPGFNNLEYAAGDLHDPVYNNNEQEWSTFLFKNMLKNQLFRNRFMGKYLTHIYTTFKPARVDSFVDKYKNQIAAEMPRDIQRWLNDNRYGKARTLTSYQKWENEVNSIYSFAASRPAVAKQHLENYFGVTTYHTFSVDVPLNGQITIEDAHISQNFSENYLHGAIVELRAIPNKGYKFRRWSDGNTNPVRQVQVNTNIALQAEFSPL
jgi:hypothetical protein